MIDIGTGPPLVLIPGIQGRWEWMEPAVGALARRCRVISFSLRGERGSKRPLDPALGFDNFVAQIDEVLDRARVERAAICGVSYGGFIAVRYAALRAERVRALVLVSAPSPAWRPDWRIKRYVGAPRLYAPLFVLRAPLRLWAEVAAAFPDRRARLAFATRHLMRVAAAPFSAVQMAERIRLSESVDFMADCARISAPTLVVTGEPRLDRAVPVIDTRTYLRAIAGAREAIIERTGHIGLVTRPERFAELVGDFVESVDVRRAPCSVHRASVLRPDNLEPASRPALDTDRTSPTGSSVASATSPTWP